MATLPRPSRPSPSFPFRRLLVVVVAIACVAIPALLAYRSYRHQTGLADYLSNGPAILPPTNLRALPSGSGSSLTDSLSWDASPGAVSYDIYRYDDKIASGLTSLAYVVPVADRVGGTTYTVTAIDSNGTESIPSAPAGTQHGTVDVSLPQNSFVQEPSVPSFVTAEPQWNAGRPRIFLRWGDDAKNDDYYDVYRDGKKIATGVWTFTYVDGGVQAGEQHTYTISGVNSWYPDHPHESAQSEPVTATAPSGPPSLSPTPVEITGIIPNDDSVTVFFKPVPGALDYRVLRRGSGSSAKYAGFFGSGLYADMVENHDPAYAPPAVMSIEMNGIDPKAGADLVVEAVDKLGPFQKMDGFMGPGGMNGTSTNGQGDPSNVPNVIARSLPFHVTTQVRSLTGSQAFFDTFRGEQPFQPVPSSRYVGAISANYGGPNSATGGVVGVENDKWEIREYQADADTSRNFVMANHFMDTIYDGASPYKVSNAALAHNNNTSNVIIPKATADISGGKVLHVTYEVDAHDSGRRWTDVFVSPVGDDLTFAAPTKLAAGQKPTTSGNLLVWEQQEYEDLNFYHPDASGTETNTDLIQAAGFADKQSTDRYYHGQMFGGITPYANGTEQQLDKRSRFDLYLSQAHYKIVETKPDGSQIVREKDFPAGTSLGFDKVQVSFVHEVYHTGNERPEESNNNVQEQYWLNYRPWSDERHWDNMGFEVLGDFSQATPHLADMQAPVYLSSAGTPPPTATPTPSATPTATPSSAPAPTPTPTPTGSPVASQVCLRLDLRNRAAGHKDVSPIALKVSQGGTSIYSGTASSGTDGTVVVTDPSLLSRLDDAATYDVSVTPRGYLPITLSASHLPTQCATFQTPAVEGDFNGDGRISLTDLVTLIRAYNGTANDTVTTVYQRTVPSLSDIVTLIREYNQVEQQ